MLFFLYLSDACSGVVGDAVSPSRMVHGTKVPLPHSRFRTVDLEDKGIFFSIQDKAINYLILQLIVLVFLL